MDEMQIQKQIGEGSFGKVYLAKWKETTVAVKILTSTSGSSDDDFPTRLPNPLLQSLEKVLSTSAFHSALALLMHAGCGHCAGVGLIAAVQAGSGHDGSHAASKCCPVLGGVPGSAMCGDRVLRAWVLE